MTSKVAFYARVSTDRQAQEGTVNSQLENLREWSKNNGYAVDPDMIFIDDGVSGATLIRPALDELRDKAVSGQIDKVIVLCPDRLARKSAHQLILIEELKRLGVEVIFTNAKISDTPEGQLLLQIQGVISEYEREKIKERMRRGTIHKAKAGYVGVLARSPFGYLYVKKNGDQPPRFDILEYEAKWVRQIFQWYIYDSLGLRAICKLLQKSGVTTRTGNAHWEPATLHGMLKNTAYIGQAGFQKKTRVPRVGINKAARERKVYPKNPNSSPRKRPESEWIFIPVPRIIDDETFRLTKQKSIENTLHAPRNNLRNQYLISRLCYCMECGYAIYGIGPNRSNRRQNLVYRCGGMDSIRRAQGRVCTQRPMKAGALEDMVWNQVKRLILTPEVVLGEYSERLLSKATETTVLENLKSKKAAELRSQIHEKERLLELYQKSIVSLAEIEPRLKNIRDKITKIESEENLLRQEAEERLNNLQLIEQLDAFTSKLKTNLENLDFNEKRKIVRLVVKRIAIDGQKRKINIQHIIPLTRPYGLRSATLSGAQHVGGEMHLRAGVYA